MRALEIIAALAAAFVIFLVLKLLGLVVHIALIGALLGLVIGFVAARMLRRTE